jgi:putative membrane protein
MIHPLLSEADRTRVRDAVCAAEANTAGEIFTVVARHSGEYRSIPLLWATLGALLVPPPLILLTLLPVTWVYLAQVAAFLVLALVLSRAPVMRWIVPRRLKHATAHGAAVDQFLAHGLHTTEARTGVLIFISLYERYAEIIADTGIASKVEPSVWQEALDGLLAEIRQGRLGDGLVGAISRVGAVLADRWPPRPGDLNELPNDLVLL